MITLFSYPELFGVADNNPYGLKVFAFMKLCKLPFRHAHIFDASAAPRGQLPYIVDDGESIGDSDAIFSHLVRKYRLAIDDNLTASQRSMDHLITRMLTTCIGSCRIHDGTIRNSGLCFGTKF